MLTELPLGLEYRDLEGKTMRRLWWEIHGRRCGICEAPLALEDLAVDHIVMRRDGGADTIDNLRPAHAVCNNRRQHPTWRPACAACDRLMPAPPPGQWYCDDWCRRLGARLPEDRAAANAALLAARAP